MRPWTTARPVRAAVWLLVCSLVISLAGCRGVFGRLDPRPSGLDSPDPELVRLVAESSNALAFDLLERLSGTPDLGGDGAGPGNVILAPISLSTLLAMLLEGADGETAEAIAGVLHLGRPAGGAQSPGASWDPAAPSGYGALLRHLAGSATDVELSVANAIWPTTGYPLVERFVETMRADFGAEVEELDLGSQEAADVIDAWAAEKTRGRIERMSDVLGLPDPGAVTVLMNAVYFKGSWTKSFDPDETEPGVFTLPDGTPVSVPMMRQQAGFKVAEGQGADGRRFTMVRLTYGKDERFAMDIAVPEPGGAGPDEFRGFVASLTPGVWKAAAAGLAERSVVLVMPKFELEYKVSDRLDAVLKDLGMAIAYTPESDFTRMSPRDPWLSRVAHKTYIRIDEEGSEAAGVSGAVMRESLPEELCVDRPFVFAITDTETGVILFLGAVADPTA